MEYICHVAGTGEDVAEHVSAVLRPLYELVQQVSGAAVEWARDFVTTIHDQLQEAQWPAFPRLRQLIVFQVRILGWLKWLKWSCGRPAPCRWFAGLLI